MKIQQSNFLYKLSSFLDDKHAGPYDVVPIICMAILFFIGITGIYSAHSYSHGHQWLQQLFWMVCGGIVYVVVSRVDYAFWNHHAPFFYFASVLLLLLLWTPLGERRFGAVRWIKIAGVAIQPSEPAKLGFIIMMSAMLACTEIGNFWMSLKYLAKFFLIFCIPTLLVFLQPDLGSALTFPVMFFAMLYVSKLSKKFFACLLAVACIALVAIAVDVYGYRMFLDEQHLNGDMGQEKYEKHSLLPLKDYQRDRIIAFLFPEAVDPNGIGMSWNLRQSLIAVGSGGVFGKGVNKGTQAKLGYLPRSVASNDFVFSVIAEERGFVGSSIVLLLYLFLIMSSLRTAIASKDRFGTYLCVGIGMLFLTHVWINIGMTIGLMPITGIPLPFLSYGGSFLLVCCFLQGLVQSVYRYQRSYT